MKQIIDTGEEFMKDRSLALKDSLENDKGLIVSTLAFPMSKIFLRMVQISNYS